MTSSWTAYRLRCYANIIRLQGTRRGGRQANLKGGREWGSQWTALFILEMNKTSYEKRRAKAKTVEWRYYIEVWTKWVPVCRRYFQMPCLKTIPITISLKFIFKQSNGLCNIIIVLDNGLTRNRAWWRHQMKTFSALLAFCAGNSPVPVNSPHKGHWRGALMFSLICAE